MILEQKLEETCEELHRATETVSSLRNRCSCLQDEQVQKKEQIEVTPFIAMLLYNNNQYHITLYVTAIVLSYC